ncbi:MAG: hypothetical protein MUD01_10205, partial [Chloroflexaceae bacterium]|nr:hypothetical protein [Chloroflexaceae bacterium]
MQHNIRKYSAVFTTQLANSFAYPLDLLARSLTIVLFMWVFFHLWRATFESVGQTSINGLSLDDTLWYLMLAETILLSRPRLANIIAEQVKDGSVAYALNKPYNLLSYHFSAALGDSVLRMAVNVLVGGALVTLLVGPPPDPLGWPLVLVAMVLGWL